MSMINLMYHYQASWCCCYNIYLIVVSREKAPKNGYQMARGKTSNFLAKSMYSFFKKITGFYLKLRLDYLPL